MSLIGQKAKKFVSDVKQLSHVRENNNLVIDIGGADLLEDEAVRLAFDALLEAVQLRIGVITVDDVKHQVKLLPKKAVKLVDDGQGGNE